MGATGSTEAGDPATSRVEAVGVPVVFTWHPVGDLEAKVGLEAGAFSNQNGTSRRTALSAGMEAPVTHSIRVLAELTAYEFEDAGSEFSGRLEWRHEPADRFSYRVGVRRDPEYSSLLSSTGEVIGGTLYGPVFSDETYISFTIRPTRHWDITVRGGLESISGTNVPDNDRDSLYAGFGRAFRIGQGSMRLGYAFNDFSYDFDLSGFPPADLGGDGITSPGAGGYWSPQRYQNHMLRVDASWPAGASLDFHAGGGFGRQRVDDIGSSFDTSTRSSDAYAGLRWRFSPSLALNGQLNYEDVAGAFDRTRARISLIWSL
jgi:hypothetical protein